MYSLVLMSALATGGETPDFGWRSGGGCVGSSCSGVVVSGCGGCTGYAAPTGCCGGYVVSSGCCGGRVGLFAGLRSRISGLFSRGCGGCTGYSTSCYGSSCYGSSCYGSSCYGSSFGGSSCYGSTTYYAPSYGISTGCTGCFGGGVPAGVIIGSTVPDGIVVGSAIPVVQPEVQPEYLASKAAPSVAAPARLTIELPADAVLFVDGEKVIGTGTTRNFHTPNLPEGTFFYDLKAEVKVDGETVTESVRVLVKAGDAKTESFGKLLAAVKSAKNPALVSK